MRLLSLALIASLLAACAQVHTLRIEAEDHLIDDTAVSPRVAERGYRRVAVMPPPSSGDEDDDALALASLEAEFIRHGLEVYTSALSPTALAAASEGDVPDVAETEQLSQVERALLRARQTNAQALLQIKALKWSDDQVSRYFVLDGDAIILTSKDFYTWHDGFGRYLKFPGVVFQGRLIDVASGEVVIAFSIRDNLLSGIEGAYVETWEVAGGGDDATLRSTSAVLDEAWAFDAHARVMRRIFTRVAACIAGDVQPGVAPDAGS